MTTPSSSTPNPKQPTAVWVLVLLAGLTTALALYQWVELVQVRHGAHALCNINATVNCETVWNTAMASRVHRWLGVPVAGLGVAWGLTALGLSLRALLRLRRGALLRPAVPALRVAAAVGAAACAVFAAWSLRAHAVCPTCVLTYLLTFSFCAVAFFGLPRPRGLLSGELKPALLWAGGLALAAYVLMLPAGLMTPKADPGVDVLARANDVGPGDAPTAKDPASRQKALEDFVSRLSTVERQGLSDALNVYRTESVPLAAFGLPSRHHVGADDAPVRLVEFTDILCPHCKHLEESLAQLQQKLPPGLLSVESRYFPLDGACNKLVARTDDNGSTRCVGARAQLCLETAKDFVTLRRKLFEEQGSLTAEKVLEIGSSGSVPRAELEACVASPETQRKLNEDLKFAQTYNLEGTPMVIVNGKEVPPVPSLLYVLALSGGQPDAPLIAMLPPPSPLPPRP